MELTDDDNDDLATETRVFGGTTVGTSTLEYTPAEQVESINFTNGSGRSIDALAYAYNAEGQLTSQADNGTTTDTYGYDASGQVISDNSTDYSFDANGNPDGSGTTVGNNNEVQSTSDWDYTYDNEGNLTQKTGVSGGPDANTIWVYGYDNANDLTSVQEYGDGSISSGHWNFR